LLDLRAGTSLRDPAQTRWQFSNTLVNKLARSLIAAPVAVAKEAVTKSALAKAAKEVGNVAAETLGMLLPSGNFVTSGNRAISVCE